MSDTAVLINRHGGAASRDPEIGAKVAAALKAAGIAATVELIDGVQCEVRAKTVAERGDELLIVGGGDGTVAAAGSALAGTATQLALLPLGTLNHFARDLGIPTDLEEAAKLIASGAARSVDVALVAGRDELGGFVDVGRDAEVAGEVIERSERKDAERGLGVNER